MPTVPPLRSSPLTVSCTQAKQQGRWCTNKMIDQKQARELVNVLQEAKQQIDPRLAEMARFGGGGGGRGYGGWGRGRGGGGRGGFRRRY